MSDATVPGGLSRIEAGYLAQSRRRRALSTVLGIVLLAMLAAGFGLADSRNAGGFLDGLHRIGDFPLELLSEALARADRIPGLMAHYLPSLIETLNIALSSTIIGTAGAVVLSLLGARNLAPARWIVAPVRRVMDLFRALPEIVVALALIFALGGGPVPAMLAITLHTFGALGKLFAEVNENADPRPVEGLASVGAGWVQRMWFAVVPQVAPNWLSYALLRLEINVRASAILGFVGAGGIGYDLKVAIGWGQGRYDAAAAIFVLLILSIILIDQSSERLRNRLIRGKA
ncbi:phosphonate ABC transporter, permease protein PhnE [Paenirhodobacter enshiensis]|uniref:Phosphonate ABC transporter permease n=1 Tax=Paenirhodobacter enshiensis TaxID=1105367 RepID=A0A086XWU8_9RHOB|nr:phosphonate ABC transporter, permease protein PhnE [Paenirhodobacter enshiensis]KFI26498.1 phosphonate ABC transporter permease [Paenirhodobacter enshiensis]